MDSCEEGRDDEDRGVELKTAKVKDPVRVKAGKKARRKGANSEREIGHLFEKWWGAKWARTPVSGGWQKDAQARADWNACGDLTCTDPSWIWTIDIKSENSSQVEHLLIRPATSKVLRWWEQAVGETPEGKQSMLVFTRMRQPWFVMTRRTDVLASVIRPEKKLIWNHFAIFLLEDLMAAPKETVLMAMQQPVRVGLPRVALG